MTVQEELLINLMDCGIDDLHYLTRVITSNELDVYDLLGSSQEKALDFSDILDNVVAISMQGIEDKFEIELAGTWDYHINYLDSSVWVNAEALRNCIRSKYPGLEEEEIEFHYKELTEAIESIL